MADINLTNQDKGFMNLVNEAIKPSFRKDRSKKILLTSKYFIPVITTTLVLVAITFTKETVQVMIGHHVFVQQLHCGL